VALADDIMVEEKAQAKERMAEGEGEER